MGIIQYFENIDSSIIEESFSIHVFSLLSRELIDPETVENMNSWEHSGFKVWLGDDTLSENEKRLFISRYLPKTQVALNRMEIVNEELAPTIRYFD